jgi:type III restriction enzyme
MRPAVNALAGRLSLRPPQRCSLELLDRVVEIAPPSKRQDVAAALAAIESEFPSVSDFERAFPSLCFALATGVGKTRLMGAFIAYLHTAHAIDNFFVLAPNLTIYNKLIADFTPGTPKYVFKGVSEFATDAPEIITGDNYASRAGTMFDNLVRCKINIFNISKINTEVRGGASPRIKRLSEYLGESYFDYLANLPDLVLLMDESHRYRASAGINAINELKPILGLELTATAYVQQGQRAIPFKNVIFDYPLRKAMEDGFVKEPAVVTRANFDPAALPPAELERIKLEDGVRLHEQTKVELETYARENGVEIVKPFVLVIARDTTHAKELVDLIASDAFFDGRYAGKVIQVDSSGSGVERDETIERLLRVERRDEPTEIVVHVNMLKEGWDVTNLYTIVPLRAASARVLIEQTIGRGLRLPYGKRTGVEAVDRLSIVAHDKFQEIVDEANRPDSVIQMQSIVIDPADLARKSVTVVARPTIEARLGIEPADRTAETVLPANGHAPAFATPEEAEIARLVYKAVTKLQRSPELVPDISYVNSAPVRERLVAEVAEQWSAGQASLPGIAPAVDVATVVERATSLIAGETISIPRIAVVPKGEVHGWFESFTLDLAALNYPAPSEDLWVQHLRTGDTLTIGLSPARAREARPEDYVVSGLLDFDDVSYDGNADVLYDLAGQVVARLRAYLAEEDVEKVLQLHQREIAKLAHAQMSGHYRENDVEYETKITAGFTDLKASAFTTNEPIRDFRSPAPNRSETKRHLFGGYKRCLHVAERFDSDTERVLSVILDRDSLKWFKSAPGQFNITYRLGGEEHGYQPDFVAELADEIVMLEPKQRAEMNDVAVLAKRDAALAYCRRASDHASTCGGKPWRYALIPHDAIDENWSLAGLLDRWAAHS